MIQRAGCPANASPGPRACHRRAPTPDPKLPPDAIGAGIAVAGGCGLAPPGPTPAGPFVICSSGIPSRGTPGTILNRVASCTPCNSVIFSSSVILATICRARVTACAWLTRACCAGVTEEKPATKRTAMAMPDPWKGIRREGIAGKNFFTRLSIRKVNPAEFYHSRANAFLLPALAWYDHLSPRGV